MEIDTVQSGNADSDNLRNYLILEIFKTVKSITWCQTVWMTQEQRYETICFAKGNKMGPCLYSKYQCTELGLQQSIILVVKHSINYSDD